MLALCFLVGVYSYTLNSGNCANPDNQQSPVNVFSSQSLYYDEKYFRFLTNNYIKLSPNEHYWGPYTAERAIGVKSNVATGSFGSFTLVKDWSISSWILEKILFRIGAEHSIEGSEYDAEMQLVHTFDANYYSPGRRVDPGTNYLVLSINFKVVEDDDPTATTLFDYMNLKAYNDDSTQNIYMKKNIKLNSMIQHQPAYLYTGTLSYGECLPALRMIFTDYHYIRRSDLNMLKAVTSRSGLLDLDQKNIKTRSTLNAPVYRNWNDLSMFAPKLNLLAYDNASFVGVNFLILLVLCLLF